MNRSKHPSIPYKTSKLRLLRALMVDSSIALFTFSYNCYKILLGAILSGKSLKLDQLPVLNAFTTKSYSLLVNSYSIDDRLGTS